MGEDRDGSRCCFVYIWSKNLSLQSHWIVFMYIFVCSISSESSPTIMHSQKNFIESKFPRKTVDNIDYSSKTTFIRFVLLFANRMKSLNSAKNKKEIFSSCLVLVASILFRRIHKWIHSDSFYRRHDYKIRRIFFIFKCA